MGTTHTPGPWKTGKPNKDTFHVLSNDSFICMLPTKDDNSESNAKIIASSPELLEALIEIIPFAEKWINDNHPTMVKAKSAIKKATE